LEKTSPALVKISVADNVTVSAKVDLPARLAGDTPVLLLAHGANNDLDHPLLAALAGYLPVHAGTMVVRFNFPYAERKASSPDPAPVLESTFKRVHDYVLDELAAPQAPLFVGGKSLGGRLAAELVSRGEEGEGLLATGLVVLGYPLHRPGRRDSLNLQPLRRIGMPSLFCVGSRDPLCDPDLLRPVLARLQHPGRLYVVEGGDHSLHRPRAEQHRPGEEEDFAGVCAEVAAFIGETTSGIRREPGS
jgi:predicted alpha/beta-hydrolase family hydrolase